MKKKKNQFTNILKVLYKITLCSISRNNNSFPLYGKLEHSYLSPPLPLKPLDLPPLEKDPPLEPENEWPPREKDPPLPCCPPLFPDPDPRFPDPPLEPDPPLPPPRPSEDPPCCLFLGVGDFGRSLSISSEHPVRKSFGFLLKYPEYTLASKFELVSSGPTVNHPALIVSSRPKTWRRRLPRQKCSMMWKISTGLLLLPYSVSSSIIRSMSTLAWMKSPSVLLLTVPFIPIKQCS